MNDTLSTMRNTSDLGRLSDEEELRAILEILVDPTFSDDWQGEENICEVLEHHPCFLRTPSVCVQYALSPQSPQALMRRTAGVLAQLVGRLSHRRHLTASAQQTSLFSLNDLKKLRLSFRMIEKDLFEALQQQSCHLLIAGQKEPKIMINLARMLILICLLYYPSRVLSFEQRLGLLERLVVSTNRKIFKEGFSYQFYKAISKGTPLSYDDKTLLRQNRVVYKRIRFYAEILSKAYVVQAFQKKATQTRA
jgi:hypothetical protein